MMRFFRFALPVVGTFILVVGVSVGDVYLQAVGVLNIFSGLALGRGVDS